MADMTPRLAWPPTVTNAGTFATVEQDTAAHHAQQVAVVLSTPVGSLIDQPAFGRPDPTFRDPRGNVELLTTAVRQWTDAPADLIADGIQRQTIDVTVTR